MKNFNTKFFSVVKDVAGLNITVTYDADLNDDKPCEVATLAAILDRLDAPLGEATAASNTPVDTATQPSNPTHTTGNVEASTASATGDQPKKRGRPAGSTKVVEKPVEKQTITLPTGDVIPDELLQPDSSLLSIVSFLIAAGYTDEDLYGVFVSELRDKVPAMLAIPLDEIEAVVHELCIENGATEGAGTEEGSYSDEIVKTLNDAQFLRGGLVELVKKFETEVILSECVRRSKDITHLSKDKSEEAVKVRVRTMLGLIGKK